MPSPLPDLLPPFASASDYNCTFKIKDNSATGTTNARGNPIFTHADIEITGWAVKLTEPRLLATINASPEEMPLKIWIRDPDTLPAEFTSFNNVACEVTLGTKLIGSFRPVPMAHPFVPSNFQFVIGAFRGNKA